MLSHRCVVSEATLMLKWRWLGLNCLADAWARESSIWAHRMRISWEIICEYIRYMMIYACELGYKHVFVHIYVSLPQSRSLFGMTFPWHPHRAQCRRSLTQRRLRLAGKAWKSGGMAGFLMGHCGNVPCSGGKCHIPQEDNIDFRCLWQQHEIRCPMCRLQM